MVVTPAQMRQLALALPESEEKSHFEQPDFRVCNKIFAGLARDQKTGSLKLSPDVQAMLLEARAAAFYPAAGAWGRSGWTHVVLAEVALGELRELLHESFRLVAPRRLLTVAAAASKPKEPTLSATKPAARAPMQKDAPKKRTRKGHRA
jgi:hypothetical protein